VENAFDWTAFFDAFANFMLRVGWWNAALASVSLVVWKHGYPWRKEKDK